MDTPNLLLCFQVAKEDRNADVPSRVLLFHWNTLALMDREAGDATSNLSDLGRQFGYCMNEVWPYDGTTGIGGHELHESQEKEGRSGPCPAGRAPRRDLCGTTLAGNHHNQRIHPG
jgi:hypothetical protein